MGYVTAQEVYNKLNSLKIDNSVVSADTMTAAIVSAEVELDRDTFTTYWALEQSGTAHAGAGDDELTDTGVFVSKDYTTHVTYVWIYSGTGSGQTRTILSHTDDTLTVDRDWDTNPDATSLYRVIYTATPAYYNSGDEIPLDGNGKVRMWLPEFPIRLIESLSIDSTAETVSDLYQWPDEGKIQLSSDNTASLFRDVKPQLIDIDWWWGVYPLDPLAKNYVKALAGLKALNAQITGTFNVPSTYQLPEGAVTIGQAYVNIREAYNSLAKEIQSLKGNLIKYPKIV